MSYFAVLMALYTSSQHVAAFPPYENAADEIAFVVVSARASRTGIDEWWGYVSLYTLFRKALLIDF